MIWCCTVFITLNICFRNFNCLTITANPAVRSAHFIRQCINFLASNNASNNVQKCFFIAPLLCVDAFVFLRNNLRNNKTVTRGPMLTNSVALNGFLCVLLVNKIEDWCREEQQFIKNSPLWFFFLVLVIYHYGCTIHAVLVLF